MKFSELYNKIFIKEQDEVGTPEDTEVAVPEDFDDVEPAPMPSTGEGEVNAEETMPAAEGSDTSLLDYVEQMEEFANKLNNPSGESLHKVLANLDKDNTPYAGISTKVREDLVRAVEALRNTADQIKVFLIQAAKVK